MNSEFKDSFERIREVERGLRKQGAYAFYSQLISKLDSMHKDTDMTVGMFTTMIQEEAEKWILNSADHG